MNIYRHKFKAACPNNNLIIHYDLTIETREIVMVEAIVEACRTEGPVFHEGLADAIYSRLGAGRHILRAFHHGVHIETRRGCE